jgi:hypothetical protein
MKIHSKAVSNQLAAFFLRQLDLDQTTVRPTWLVTRYPLVFRFIS